MGAQFCKCLDTPGSDLSPGPKPPLSPKVLNGYTPTPDSKRRPEPVIGKRINLEDQFDSAASSGGGQLLVKGPAAASSGGGGGGKEYYDGPRIGKRQVHTGPRGGKYYINDAGNKMYNFPHEKTYFE